MYSNVIDRANPQKLYHQLLEILRGLIEKGGWGVGTQMPTEEQLCSQYNVSKATVRLAIAELVSLGYLKKIQGKGTFVRRRKPENRITMLINLDESDIYHNSSYITRVIVNKTIQPSEEIGDHLNLAEEDHCFLLSRLTIVNGAPLFIQKLYVPFSLLPGLINSEEITDISQYEFLENKCSIKIQRVTEMADVTHISKEDAELLESPSNISVLRLRHICYAHGDAPISFSESFYKTDTSTRTLEFERLRM
ncbi:MAG: GntR family transcriptional regulator [Nitrospirae bacterium]|nr:GntR family transcriptional regulator [Nitrospirota bacterium]